ncbi:MAG TPA: NAD(P)H-binding protein [Pseudonocardiaceae bacterium]|jgi:uncharacterized protein YbjT (DUF2867 family)|nr:NAD(P)H-binding protein [Pseudonocardiaceae bacterium]
MILITGATGNVGREVVRLLLADGQFVAAVTRDPATAVLPDGADVLRADPDLALPGVRAVLISPRAVGDGTAGLLKRAAEQGATRVVVLSAATVSHGGGYRRFADEFRAVEDAAVASGLEWTLLRCTDFAANNRIWAGQINAGDVVRGAYGNSATWPVHEHDVASVAARALVTEGHIGQSYVLSGPESLSQRDRVAIIGQAIGRDLTWQEVAPEHVRAAMLALGAPPDAPDRLLGYLADRVEDAGPHSDTVEVLLGRPARTFAEWAAEHAAEFGG